MRSDVGGGGVDSGDIWIEMRGRCIAEQHDRNNYSAHIYHAQR